MDNTPREPFGGAGRGPAPDPAASSDEFSFGPLDGLLRQWHSANSERARDGRARLLAALAARQAGEGPGHNLPAADGPVHSQLEQAVAELGAPRSSFSFRRIVMNPFTRAAACLMLLASLLALLIPYAGGPAAAADGGIVLVPDGGRLDALDEQGRLLGPCPLKHTDVSIEVTGHFSRVTLRQTYTNTYPSKIEAVYTFPMSHRAAVDRMSMIVGDRVVVGEVKEREAARRVYEQARDSGYVASLLEQERPNIFTQSVANIEPGATVEVEIAYIEMLESRDGVHRLAFPMVVGPRYIPGGSSPLLDHLPALFQARRGLVLLGPAVVTCEPAADPAADAAAGGVNVAPALTAVTLEGAAAIEPPGAAWWEQARAGAVTLDRAFTVQYADGAKEKGELYSDGCGQVNGRWFFLPEQPAPRPSTGFAQGTDEVPDAGRITPMPVRPPMRAGHDISLSVSIDTGGPALKEIESELHDVIVRGSGSKATVALRSQREIPNRDFILSWKTDAAGVSEGVFVHADERQGGFVTLVLNPPPRVEDQMVRARELVFVLDTSGSMSGFPIEKAKEVMSKAIDAMRPSDTFNVVTFANGAHVLWDEARPATAENRALAQQFLASRRGGGGTEMMKAIEAALVRKGAGAEIDPMALANLPADGRQVVVVAPYAAIESAGGQAADEMILRASADVAIPLRLGLSLPTVLQPEGVRLRLAGQWVTEKGRRLFVVREAGFARDDVAPMRICMFLTDGYVGNDQAIVQAVRDNAGSTRVFSFGIGNSVNRWLLEQMALAGRGEAEIVTLADAADEAVERFTRRIQNPVLTDISVKVDGVELSEFVSGSPSAGPGLLPDLYDLEPLMLHARYGQPGSGTITIAGRTGNGRFERTLALELPAQAPEHQALPALWARSKVEALLAPHLAAVQQGSLAADVRREVVALGETFGILTPYTSFVAVEKARITLGGRPMLVSVPIELPEGTRWEGFFGDGGSSLPCPPLAIRDRLLDSAGQVSSPPKTDDPAYAFQRKIRDVGAPAPAAPAAPAAGRSVDADGGFGGGGSAGVTAGVQVSAGEGRMRLGAPMASPDVATRSYVPATAGQSSDVRSGVAVLHLGLSADAGQLGRGNEVLHRVLETASPGAGGQREFGEAAGFPAEAPSSAGARSEAIGYEAAGAPVSPVAKGLRQALDAGAAREQRAQIGEIVTSLVRPEAWESHGGTSAAVVADADELRFEARQDTDEARRLVEEARALAELLEVRLESVHAGVANIVASTPFQPEAKPALSTVVIYDVRDLLSAMPGAADDAMAQLVEVIRTFVAAPGGWFDAATATDAAASLRALDGLLVVRAPAEVHLRIDVLLAQVRDAIRLPQPEPLRRAGEAAQTLRSPFGGAERLEVNAERTLIVHPVGDLVAALAAPQWLSPTEAAEALVHSVRESVAPESWKETGGNGRIAAAAGILVVEQTPAVQSAVDAYLQSARSGFDLPPRPLRMSPEAQQAQAAMLRKPQARAERIERLNELFRRLDPSLFAAVVALEDSDSALVDRAKLTEALGGRVPAPIDRPARVTVLLKEADDGAVEAVRRAGLKVEAINAPMRVVVGVVEIEKLGDVALADGVRRIELLEETAAPPSGGEG